MPFCTSHSKVFRCLRDGEIRFQNIGIFGQDVVCWKQLVDSSMHAIKILSVSKTKYRILRLNKTLLLSLGCIALNNSFKAKYVPWVIWLLRCVLSINQNKWMRETCQFAKPKLHFQACMFKSLYLRPQFYIPLTQEYGNLSETIHEIISFQLINDAMSRTSIARQVSLYILCLVWNLDS